MWYVANDDITNAFRIQNFMSSGANCKYYKTNLNPLYTQVVGAFMRYNVVFKLCSMALIRTTHILPCDKICVCVGRPLIGMFLVICNVRYAAEMFSFSHLCETRFYLTFFFSRNDYAGVVQTTAMETTAENKIQIIVFLFFLK